MIEKIDSPDIVALIGKLPEQAKYDCKADLHLSNDERKSELIKDIVAIANAHGDHTGYLFFGVDLKQSQPLVGISNTFDDANLQQMVNSKLERPVNFIYYEREIEGSRVGITVIPKSQDRPHIVRAAFGKLKDGQIPIRRGSSTTWANSEDLKLMFGESAGHNDQADLETLVKRASDANVSASSLGLDAWALWKRINQIADAEWIRQEIAGYRPDHGQEMEEYRTIDAYVGSEPLNPNALRLGSLSNISQLGGADLTKSTWSLGHSLAQLEELNRKSKGKAALVDETRLPTRGGGESDAWVYSEPDSIQWVITRIRDQIISRIMATEVKLS